MVLFVDHGDTSLEVRRARTDPCAASPRKSTLANATLRASKPPFYPESVRGTSRNHGDHVQSTVVFKAATSKNRRVVRSLPKISAWLLNTVVFQAATTKNRRVLRSFPKISAWLL